MIKIKQGLDFILGTVFFPDVHASDYANYYDNCKNNYHDTNRDYRHHKAISCDG